MWSDWEMRSRLSCVNACVFSDAVRSEVKPRCFVNCLCSIRSGLPPLQWRQQERAFPSSLEKPGLPVAPIQGSRDHAAANADCLTTKHELLATDG